MADHTDRFREQGPPLSRLSRRQALAVAGGVGVAAVAGIWPRTALAQPAAAVPNGAGFYRFRLGTCTITLLSDGQAPSAIFPGWGGDPARRDIYEPFLREHLIDPSQVVNDFIPMEVVHLLRVRAGGVRVLKGRRSGHPLAGPVTSGDRVGT